MPDLLEQGRAELARGAWKAARASFEAAVRLHPTPEAFEELGTACAALNDGVASIAAREEAFRGYRQRNDRHGAARVAVWLADDYIDFRGDHAVANGWVQQAVRMVEGLPPCYEVSLVTLTRGHLALIGELDAAGALRLAAEARSTLRASPSPDLEMMATAIEGLALVSEGKIPTGMGLLDEATVAAVGGETKDLTLIGATCCYMIQACERVGDFDRAGQWCDRVKEFCRRWRIGSFFSICRTRYASLLTWRGEWLEAEEELTAAAEELQDQRPPLLVSCRARLGELRRRQGRFSEARALFGEAVNSPLALLGQGAIALDEGDAATAVDYAERFLRRVPDDARTDRAPGLELLVRAQLKQGLLEQAKNTQQELRDTARLLGTETSNASALFADGLVAAAAQDLATASDCFEDAVDRCEQLRLPHEAARARLELARVLLGLGRTAAAEAEARSALESSRKLGAAWLEQSVVAFLREHFSGSAPKASPAERPGQKELTPREKELLHHLAEGKDNEQIAESLYLSVRTVERHISNIYLKLGLTGKSARVAAAAYALKHSR